MTYEVITVSSVPAVGTVVQNVDGTEMVVGGNTLSRSNIRANSHSCLITISTSRNRNQHDPVLVPGVDSTLDEPGVVAELEPVVW